MNSRPKVLVYEFYTGGGAPPGDLPQELAAEALGMLSAVLTDFRRWGAVRTIMALDPRCEESIPGINRNTLPADEIIITTPEDYQEIYGLLLQRCDAVLVIAPETGEVLSELISQAENAGIPHLGSSSVAARIAGDKAECYRIFSAGKLRTPFTRVIESTAAYQEALQMDFPLILKPVDGIGCEGVCLVDSPDSLLDCLAIVGKATAHEHILLQSFVSGVHASVSLLVADRRALPLSLNRQLVEAGVPFRYLGSQVPLEHALATQAWETACEAVGLIDGLRGYVGVDVILTNDGIQLIEINPRLTTSYIGLRQVSEINLAQAIWNVCLFHELPDSVPLHGQVAIEKNDPGTWGIRELAMKKYE